MRALLVLIACLAPAGIVAASEPSGSPVERHVREVAASVAPRVARAGTPVRVSVSERAAATAGPANGSVDVSTGLLAILDSDAQLAMILGYELSRRAPGPPQPGRRHASAGGSVGRAIATGAVVGAVGYGVNDAMRGSAPIARGAVVGGATAGSGAALQAAWPRRGSSTQVASDDQASYDGMRAAIAAGYDGRTALSAWDRLIAATPLGGEPGGYADAAANKSRRAAAQRALRRSGQTSKGNSGYVVGNDSYRQSVLSHMTAWKLDADAAPAPVTPDAGTGTVADIEPGPSGGGRPWLDYQRSGGITGWTAQLLVDSDGSTWAKESRDPQSSGARKRVVDDDFDNLERLVKEALARPPRKPSPELKQLRDGQQRSLSVRTAGKVRTLTLSDGYVMAPGDRDLVTALEGILRK